MIKMGRFKVVFFSRDTSASDISFFRLRAVNCLQSKLADKIKNKIRFQQWQGSKMSKHRKLSLKGNYWINYWVFEPFWRCDLGIINFFNIEWYYKHTIVKFVGMDQITYKNDKKAAKRKLTKFFFLAIDQSNPPRFSYTVSNGIKPPWDETAFFQTSSFSLYIL